MVATAHGVVAPGFEPVAEAFARNLAERGELGAAFAAELDGEPVVDLWGGVADAASGRPWERDTLCVVFSGTKGLVAVCLLLLVERGALALDDPVAAHWPEFAAHGKQAVTVAELASHQARLPGIRTRLRLEDVTDDTRLAALLAAQAPEGDPRAPSAYHAFTYGWLCGELIRRVGGRSAGRYFAEEVAAPLGLELWIGLPAALEPRVATLSYGPGWGSSPTWAALARGDDELVWSVWGNPPLFPAGPLPWNGRSFHAAEIPGGGAIGTARSMARLYACLARGGELDGVRLLAPQTAELGRRELSRFREAFSGEPMAYGTGFQLQTELGKLGPPPQAFGHGGAGGSIHGAWPHERVGFSYAMNQLREDPVGDPRSLTLLRALHEAVNDVRRREPEGPRRRDPDALAARQPYA